MKTIFQSILILFGLLCRTDIALSGDRVALVIGNSAYANTVMLANPSNDANDIASALKRLGFDVVLGLDLDQNAMRDTIREFSGKLTGAKIGLFFYAGHGLQVRGNNYLIPVDASLNSESDLDFSAIQLNLVLRQMEREVPTSVVFLDACRDNPLARNLSRSMGTRSANIGRGLAQVDSGVGTMIAFATQPGNVALDGNGRNSPFTKALLSHIETPGIDLSGVMIHVRNSVLKSTDGKQVPWEHSSLTGRVYFSNSPEENNTGITNNDVAVEIAYWNSISSDKNIDLIRAYLARYPNGVFSAIAKLRIEEMQQQINLAVVRETADQTPVKNGDQLAEIQNRLYELNYDPGEADGQIGPATKNAIREFQSQAGLAIDMQPKQGLLARLRSLKSLKPWGAIVFSQNQQKWGMAWSHETRREAVASAQRSCGNGKCEAELTFFGNECGVFAHSSNSWSITARSDREAGRKAALSECQDRSGKCKIIATVCADGSQKQAVDQ